MRLLDRYLLRELLLPFGYCMGGFLIFWVAFDLFKEMGRLQELRLHASDIVEYYAVQSPEFLVVVLPVALLLALLYSLTNHARYNEITAIRAAGVSLWRLSMPYFAMGLMGGVVVFVINEWWLADNAARVAAIESRRSQPAQAVTAKHWVNDFGFRNARDGRRWQMAAFNMVTAEMVSPKVDWLDAEGRRWWIFADRAVPTNGGWMFLNATEFIQANSTHVPRPQTSLLMKPFSETPDEIRSEVRISPRLGVFSSRGVDVPISVIRDYLRLHPNASPSEKNWLHTKLHGRLAAPWTCLVVVLIAIPFGSATGRRNVFVGVASSIFICLAYFVLLQTGQAFGMGGTLPPWLAGWFPNLVFGLGGAWLTARAR